jgi:hypothetical protein
VEAKKVKKWKQHEKERVVSLATALDTAFAFNISRPRLALQLLGNVEAALDA